MVYETYYNIVAKAEGDGTPTRGEFRQMLQTLLNQRFNLEFHHETKEMPVYALVVPRTDRNSRKAPTMRNSVAIMA
jgi:uncharacterized protein (TIGR03435 family)